MSAEQRPTRILFSYDNPLKADNNVNNISRFFSHNTVITLHQVALHINVY